MSDQRNVPQPAAEEFPPPSLPTIFADGVLNLAHTSESVKFYLFRHDPGYREANISRINPYAQVVMPMDSFVNTVVFFDKVLANLVAQNRVLQEVVGAKKSALSS
jgi:hypothetical protein